MDLSQASEQSGQTLSTTIATTLRAAISNGEFAPGSKLRLDELRVMFGVSLSPLREALSRLSAEGFVVMEDQRGYRVAPISEENLEEVTKLRAMVETFALREAIQNGDDRWEGEVVASLYRLNKLEKVEDTADRSAWEAAHRDLHYRLISACRMPLLLSFSSMLHDLNDRYRRLFLAARPFDKTVRREHTDICNAALERDAELACGIMREHIERTGANIRKALLKKDQPLKQAA
ncbi:GntR family transcriptional regulator [Ramlibacter henchirensis]|uniref:GntR family transcriptional regulator n=1 Tax=Ramlibacter henchirensis TaxID=204072 RepID=A0A4Z0BTI3_9BURK|nr:GntR family transcriptional regulator [Ramlibacter henchirensis]TFZ02606.1 GntR family transcriptional regulator [Ramlibacter henchirensis]